MIKRVLIVMAKEPRAGATKTRLTPPLSGDEAAGLYRCLLLDTFQIMAGVDGVERTIAYDPEGAAGFFAALAPEGFTFVAQRGRDLSERLDQVLREFLSRGFAQAVVMNSDGPTLPPEYVARAFAVLDDPEVDVVLGPSEDGGYYLVGLKRPCSTLFDVTMSTPRVLQDTLGKAEGSGLRVALLAPWYDVDTWDDLARLVGDLARLPARCARNTRRFLATLDLGRHAGISRTGDDS